MAAVGWVAAAIITLLAGFFFLSSNVNLFGPTTEPTISTREPSEAAAALPQDETRPAPGVAAPTLTSQAVATADSSATSAAQTEMDEADTDQDGLTDAQENVLDTDANDPDSDGDGLKDGDELLIYNTDPLNLDGDGDSLNDFDEINVHKTNPRLSDTDDDGQSDGLEAIQGTDPLDPNPPTIEPSPTPTCPAVDGPFAAAWRDAQAEIGCATGDEVVGLIAEENFELGKMFWREPIDYAQALVLFNNGAWRIFEHAPFVEGSPDFSCPDADTSPQCPPTPKRGFGMMWCDISDIRGGLGNATDCERGYQGAMQAFQNGFMIQSDTGNIYVFLNSGTWQRR